MGRCFHSGPAKRGKLLQQVPPSLIVFVMMSKEAFQFLSAKNAIAKPLQRIGDPKG